MGNPIKDTMRDFDPIGKLNRNIAQIELDLEAQAVLDRANIEKITKIVDKWYNERYDTDWDFLQGSLMKIYKLVHKK